MGRKRLPIDWGAQPLGQVPDSELAKTLGVSKGTVRHYRAQRDIPRCTTSFQSKTIVDWDTQPLGEVSDAKLARELGVDRSSVAKARRRHGISPSDPSSRKKNIDWAAQPLGEMTDQQLADKLRVHVQTVTKTRNRLGIAAYRRRDLPRRALREISSPRRAYLSEEELNGLLGRFG